MSSMLLNNGDEVCRKLEGCVVQHARIFSGLPCSGWSNSYGATEMLFYSRNIGSLLLRP